MRLAWSVLGVPVAALLATVWLPFVNGPRLWLGLPSMLVWSVAWVLMVTPALAFLERRRPSGRSEGER
ncbi:hypothetical protein AGRA3207_002119 [Actinomadura graeca]|uniref:DUF3311 domain-containing protein n=1 Tax=Actinomadura graeca TaxID=2750812 RepID=A0ABX8QV18_9ACTN|nr:hypothetical protein [Actinomadura graeca]QXJ21282.1 hypothetical protein AGRA3207_002119 [Actinomadura graeca]